MKLNKSNKLISAVLVGFLCVQTLPMNVFANTTLNKMKEEYNITDVEKSFKGEINETSKHIEKLSVDINNKKNELSLKEKELSQVENEIKLKKDDLKKNMEYLMKETEKLNITLQSYQSENMSSSFIMTYLDMFLGEESLVDGFTKAQIYKTLTESTEKYILELQERYEDLKKESLDLKNKTLDLSKQKGKLIYDKQDLEGKEKELKLKLSELEEKERVRVELMLAKEEESRQASLTEALLKAKFDRMKLDGSSIEYDTSKGTLLGYPMYLKVDTENPKYFITPTQGRFTSGYGWRDIGAGPEFHYGIDIANGNGTPIYSAAKGVVIHVGEMSSYGQLVKVKHFINGTTYTTVYAHLSAYAVQLGDEVEQGELIALMGTTGRSTGPHLHFEVQLGTGHNSQNPLNPVDWINKPIEKPKPENET